jgi:hypothetical protein
VVARNGLIHLDVHSESDVDPASSGTRAAALNNQFSLEHGQTAVIAGFLAEQTVVQYSNPQTSGQVPLFGKSRRGLVETTEGVERIETIVLLTPHIVNNEAAGDVGKTETPAARGAAPAAKRESAGKVRLAGATESADPAPAGEPRRRTPSPEAPPAAQSTSQRPTPRRPVPPGDLNEPQRVPETNAAPLRRTESEIEPDKSSEPDLNSIPPLFLPELNNVGPRITPGRRSKSDF